MGRPPIGKVAMTGAERQRRYWAKHHVDKPVRGLITALARRTKGKSDQEIEAIIARVTDRLRRKRKA